MKGRKKIGIGTPLTIFILSIPIECEHRVRLVQARSVAALGNIRGDPSNPRLPLKQGITNRSGPEQPVRVDTESRTLKFRGWPLGPGTSFNMVEYRGVYFWICRLEDVHWAGKQPRA